VFIIIILVLQFRIIPLISGIGGTGALTELGLSSTGTLGELDVSSAFLYLLLVQGFFSGLIIGKLTEGRLKAGVKHSFILMIFSFTFSTVANLFL